MRLRSFIKNNRNFAQYVIIGLSGVVLDFVSFIFLNKVLQWDPILANIVSTSLGITNNFVLNALYNFKKRDNLLARFLLFYSVGIAGLLLSTIILRVLHDSMGIDPVAAKIISLIFVLITQYTLNKRFSFSDAVSNAKVWSFVKRHRIEISLLAIAAALFVASLPYIFSNDEAFYLLNGKQIFSGLLPYGDYFNHHMPGMDFVSAFLYIFSGDNLLLFRIIFNILIFGLLVVNTILIYRAFNPLAARLYVVCMALFHIVWLHVAVDTSLIAYLLPLIFIIIYTAPRPISTKRLVTVSLLLFMIPFMNLAYSLVAFVLYLMLIAQTVRAQRAHIAKDVVRVLGILALPYAIFGLYLLLTKTAGDFVFENWTFNQVYYAALINDHIHGTIGLVPRLLSDTLTQITTIVQTFNGHFLVQALFLLAYPAAAFVLWKSNKKHLALGVLFLLLVINPRNNLYAPAGILSTLAETVNYSSIYKSFGLFLAAVCVPWYVGRYAKADKSIGGTLGKGFAIVFLLVVPLMMAQFFLGTLQRVVLDDTTDKQANFVRYAIKEPQQQAAKLDQVLGPDDYYWSGPVDFDVQVFIQAKRAGTYNLWLPWLDACVECRAELMQQLAATKPKVIVFRPFALSGKQYPYSADLTGYLYTQYTHIRAPGWEDYYVRNDWLPEFKAKAGLR